jgi:diacylglycerol kinase
MNQDRIQIMNSDIEYTNDFFDEESHELLKKQKKDILGGYPIGYTELLALLLFLILMQGIHLFRLIQIIKMINS